MAAKAARGTEAQRLADTVDGERDPGTAGTEETAGSHRRLAELVWLWPVPAVAVVAVASELDGRRGAAVATATVLVLAGARLARVAESQGLTLATFAVAIAALGLFAWRDGGSSAGQSGGKPIAGRTPTSEELRRQHDLRGAVLGDDTPLPGADLDGRLLQGVKADGTDLAGASLVGARLDGAHLADANLRGVSLADACLRGADLTRAKIAGADFRGADVEGAVGVTDERLAIGFGTTRSAGACR